MQTKNTLRGMLVNGEVLNLSMNVIKGMLELGSALNAVYSSKMVVYHLLMLICLKRVLVFKEYRKRFGIE